MLLKKKKKKQEKMGLGVRVILHNAWLKYAPSEVLGIEK